MVSCARATRGLRRPSLDTRSGRPSSPPSREKVEERGRSIRAVKDSLPAPSGEVEESEGSGSTAAVKSSSRPHSVPRFTNDASRTMVCGAGLLGHDLEEFDLEH